MENKPTQNGPAPLPQPSQPNYRPAGGEVYAAPAPNYPNPVNATPPGAVPPVPGPAGPSYSYANQPTAKLPSGGPTTQKSRESLKSILSTIAILILAPILAILITSFLFQSYEVDGPSMQNTLHNGDRLVVLKAGKTWSKVTHTTYMPARGAIIVFDSPDLNENKQLIKRVIGLPGDRVRVKEGSVSIFNKDHPNGYNPDKNVKWDGTANDANSPGNIEVTVGKGEVFVMGDNRTNSLDSRIFGPIKTHQIAGRLVFRVFPFNKAQKF